MFWSLAGQAVDRAEDKQPGTEIPLVQRYNICMKRQKLPFFLCDDQHVIEEEEVDLLFCCSLGENARVLYIGCKLTPLQ